MTEPTAGALHRATLMILNAAAGTAVKPELIREIAELIDRAEQTGQVDGYESPRALRVKQLERRLAVRDETIRQLHHLLATRDSELAQQYGQMLENASAADLLAEIGKRLDAPRAPRDVLDMS